MTQNRLLMFAGPPSRKAAPQLEKKTNLLLKKKVAHPPLERPKTIKTFLFWVKRPLKSAQRKKEKEKCPPAFTFEHLMALYILTRTAVCGFGVLRQDYCGANASRMLYPSLAFVVCDRGTYRQLRCRSP